MLKKVISGNSSLIEIVDVSAGSIAGESASPLQLLKFQGAESDPLSTLWFAAGLDGTSRSDTYIINLFHKALSRGLFNVAADVYLTPMLNPFGVKNGSRLNLENIDLLKNFPCEGNKVEKLAKETSTIMRWAQLVKPRAVITFSSGEPMIRCENIPENVVERLAEISEKSVWGKQNIVEANSMPSVESIMNAGNNNPSGSSSYLAAYAQFLEENNAVEVAEQIKPNENWESTFGLWCAQQGFGWIHFGLTDSKKSFEDVAQEEWRTCVGPALKWLSEGLRFNPPKEETPALPKLQVIPVLEMPPEFANL